MSYRVIVCEALPCSSRSVGRGGVADACRSLSLSMNALSGTVPTRLSTLPALVYVVIRVWARVYGTWQRLHHVSDCVSCELFSGVVIVMQSSCGLARARSQERRVVVQPVDRHDPAVPVQLHYPPVGRSGPQSADGHAAVQPLSVHVVDVSASEWPRGAAFSRACFHVCGLVCLRRRVIFPVA